MKTKLPGQRLKELETLLDADDPDSLALCDIDGDLMMMVASGKVDDDLGNLTPVERSFYAAWWLEGEVINGGFNQFLLNQGPACAREALAFCESRGLDQVADLLKRAIAVLPGGSLPDTYHELEAILVDDLEDGEPGPIDRAHDELNSAFYESNLEDQLKLERLRFVREHPDEFFEQ